jgi:hypothetical protein
MFFTEIGTKEAELPTSAFTEALHKQPKGLYKLPKN